ncbi:GNAT family N-acetyltransferase [uncultured Hyphomonas sp.]|uniref:GNAT family N-acetyltransferase n=1 Tax=uncultured Hyphomonas sp. TaxID=225298 RepID=UPI000C5BE118|nr:hypothetical protein [Hyphomonadaceae bacterium]MBA29700.1 hypothetical protein [Hyphomonadaceae bacterium]|tara:strand:- start:68488 stop:68979 length:492 start_codon:yes stop_codon:yes gene_type:complete
MFDYTALDGKDATPSDVNQFVRLVTHGGAVKEHFVRQGVRHDGAKLVFARSEEITVGVAALKVPVMTYRNGIAHASKSGHPLPADQYPFELGYVAVSEAHGQRGIASTLISQVIELAKGSGLFATTSNPAMMGTLLPRAGFKRVGTSWLNDDDEQLHLYILDQ